LLKFQKDRSLYRSLLRVAIQEFGISLLTYNITSNHVHLVAYVNRRESIAGLMQKVAGDFARKYNRRKQRSGAFWEGRYHATMVDGGRYLQECMRYVELNMVRCGVVEHPQQWEWSGYEELMGRRDRNRLLAVEKLLELLGYGDVEKFRGAFEAGVRETIAREDRQRQPQWTESLAVGGSDFVESLTGRIRNRQQIEKERVGDAWVLRERDSAVYGLEKVSHKPEKRDQIVGSA
jgi:putative transposase